MARRRFSDYYLEMEQQAAGYGPTSDSDQMQPSAEAKMNAFKVIMKKYSEEANKFVNDLAEKDEEVRQALQGGGDQDDMGPVDPNKPDDQRDEVKPPAADGSPGMNTDQAQGE